jgi:hypothetical protein
MVSNGMLAIVRLIQASAVYSCLMRRIVSYLSIATVFSSLGWKVQQVGIYNGKRQWYGHDKAMKQTLELRDAPGPFIIVSLYGVHFPSYMPGGCEW